MVEYSALLFGITNLVSQAISKSDGTNNSMLKHFDFTLLKRLAILDNRQTDLRLEHLLKRLRLSINWKHEIHDEVLSLQPKSLDKGVIYLITDKVSSRWNIDEFVSIMIVLPHNKYCYIGVEFCSKNHCVRRFYCGKVTKERDGYFLIDSHEGNLMSVLEILEEFE